MDMAAPPPAPGDDEPVVVRVGDAFLVDGDREAFPGSYEECEDRYPDGVCPWFRCRYHLGVDVDEKTGALGTNCGRVMTAAPRRYSRAVRERDHAMPVTSVDEVEWERRARAVVRVWIGGEQPTCSLWHAQQRTRTLEEMGDMLNVTRERVRQLEVKATHKVLEVSIRDGVRIVGLGIMGREMPVADLRRFLARARAMLERTRERADGLRAWLARNPESTMLRERLAREDEILAATEHNVRVIRREVTKREIHAYRLVLRCLAGAVQAGAPKLVGRAVALATSLAATLAAHAEAG